MNNAVTGHEGKTILHEGQQDPHIGKLALKKCKLQVWIMCGSFSVGQY